MPKVPKIKRTVHGARCKKSIEFVESIESVELLSFAK
jgi:hypothetical protein